MTENPEIMMDDFVGGNAYETGAPLEQAFDAAAHDARREDEAVDAPSGIRTARLVPLEGFGPIAMEHGVFLNVAVSQESMLDVEREVRAQQPALQVFLHTLLRYLAGREWTPERKSLAVLVWNRFFPAWISNPLPTAITALEGIATHLGMEVGRMDGPNQRHVIFVARAAATHGEVDIPDDDGMRDAARTLQQYADLAQRAHAKSRTKKTGKVPSACPVLQGFTQPEVRDEF